MYKNHGLKVKQRFDLKNVLYYIHNSINLKVLETTLFIRNDNNIIIVTIMNLLNLNPMIV